MGSPDGRWPLVWCAAAGLVFVVLAGMALERDSVTVDEPSHLVAGYAALAHLDCRLSPDHPPLVRMALTLPLLTTQVGWFPAAGEEPADEVAEAAWQAGDFFVLGRRFLQDWNDGQALVRRSRWVAVVMSVALIAVLAGVARRWCGWPAAAVTATCAALDPLLLAHGHLATIDVGFTLAVVVALVAAERWLVRRSWSTLAVLAVALAAVVLSKFSWFAVIPAIAAMYVVATRREGIARQLRGAIVPTFAVTGIVVAAIWTAYGWRYAAATGPGSESATMHVVGDASNPRPIGSEAAWEAISRDAQGRPRPGLATAVGWMREMRLLPEAFLYGTAYVVKKGYTRASYLRGEYSMTGFRSYFAWAFALKTPVPMLILLGVGVTSALMRAGPKLWFSSLLGIGLVVFALVYLALLVTSALNIGARHLLPVAPGLWLLLGFAWPRPGQAGERWLKAGVVITVVTQAWVVLGSAPHFIGYFNSLGGGWRQAHHALVDSNLDWGQDLLRLERHLGKESADTPVWLAQAGGVPLPPGLAGRVDELFGSPGYRPSGGAVGAGVYVVSATELVGVYRPLARLETWRDPAWSARYEAEHLRSGGRPGRNGDPGTFEAMRRLRLVSRLTLREPDERVGRSLFVYRLSAADIERETRP